MGGVGGGLGLDGGGGSGVGGTTSTPPVFLDECTGVIDPGTQAMLEQGGAVDASHGWLYPYDRTVFPRGLLPPVLQWSAASSGPAQAVRLRLKSKTFEYVGCFGPTSPAQLGIPPHVWDQATSHASGVSDPIAVELTTLQGGVASGPITQQWAVAPATLKGAIYYNTYDSAQNDNKGAVMRILPGQEQPEVYLGGGCVGCHSLSANGKTMVAASHSFGKSSASYDVQGNPSPNPPPMAGNLDEAGFAAVYPDGSRFLTTGSPGQTLGILPFAPGNVPGMSGPRASRLFDAASGQPLTASGWTVQYAKMPMFSPDGRHVVFNHHSVSNGHTLAMMDFEPSTNTFSGYVELFTDPVRYPGWPAFTPDAKGVIFSLGDTEDYVGSFPARPAVSRSDLWYVDVATRQAVPLAQLGGFAGGQSYLPYPGRDERYDYFPTVSPVAAGGYFWVFFTSRRNYGNTVVGPVDLAVSKKLWAAAIDIDPLAGNDPSHPAFYLPGQELEAGNKRAFAALEPCRADGATCSTGVDCCCGGCESGVCGCPDGCSNLDEKCTTDADCCDPTTPCIGGFCAQVVK